jgi:hypothetical protein
MDNEGGQTQSDKLEPSFNLDSAISDPFKTQIRRVDVRSASECEFDVRPLGETG